MPLKSAKVDRPLSNLSVRHSMEGSINQEVAPVVQVKRTNDTYRIYDRNFRIPATLRAEKGLARQHYFDVSLGSYNLESHALKDYVGVDDKDNFDEIDYRADTVVELTEKIEMRAEKSCAALAATTSFSNGVSLATAAQWSLDTTASNPIPMVDTGTSVIMSNSNVKPNWMVCPRDSFVAAKNHASVIDRVKYTSKELDENILAGLFSIQKLLVPFVNEDTAVRGETASLSNIWTSDFVLLGYSPGKAGPRTLSTFYRFQKNTPAVRTWIDDEREGAEAIEVAKKYQFKVVASLTAYYINNAV